MIGGRRFLVNNLDNGNHSQYERTPYLSLNYLSLNFLSVVDVVLPGEFTLRWGGILGLEQRRRGLFVPNIHLRGKGLDGHVKSRFLNEKSAEGNGSPFQDCV